MKKLSLAAIMLAALGAGPALAADLPSMKAPPLPPPPPPILWTGFYGGLNIGGGWSENNVSESPVPFLLAAMQQQQCFWGWGCGWGWGNGGNNWTPVPTANGGVAFVPTYNSSSAGGGGGGGQIGYNYQLGGSFVIGVETDFQGTSIGGFERLPWFGTVRGRAGFLITPALLIYGTAGFAYGGVDAWGYSDTRTGWTAGGGVEWMFMPNWSAKIEYLYVDLSSGGYYDNGGWGWGGGFGSYGHPQLNVVRAGVNYHFNFGAPAPVVARY